MGQVNYDMTYSETRQRLTVAFQLILAIPHLVIVNAWSS